MVQSARLRRIESNIALVHPSGPILDPFMPGTYLFASVDFVEFATKFPAAHLALDHLCGLKAANLEIFVREIDADIARRYADQFHGSVRVKMLPDSVLLLIGQLVVIEVSGKAKLYVCYDAGFAFLNGWEAIRIRTALSQAVIAAQP